MLIIVFVLYILQVSTLVLSAYYTDKNFNRGKKLFRLSENLEYAYKIVALLIALKIMLSIFAYM